MVWESHISPAVQQGRHWLKMGASEEGLRHLHRSKGQVSVLIWNLYIGTSCKLLFAECISDAYLTKVREFHWTRWSLWTLLLPSCFSCVRLCDSMDCSLPGSSVHESPKNTGVNCPALLQGIFLTLRPDLTSPASLQLAPPEKPFYIPYLFQ